MSWLILVILIVLGMLIVAGPVLEDLIDRVWPPGTNPAARTGADPIWDAAEGGPQAGTEEARP